MSCSERRQARLREAQRLKEQWQRLMDEGRVLLQRIHALETEDEGQIQDDGHVQRKVKYDA